jgi:predicted RNA-binding protein with PUA-like domain
MAARTWLVKSEPFKYSWDQLVQDGSTYWDGVRNAQARNNLAAMQKGDRVLYYHSNEGKEVVGVAKVTRAAYPDPTSDDERWVVVDLAPVKALARPVTLAEIKADATLRDIPLVKQSRLSVMPIPKDAFERIVAMGKAGKSEKAAGASGSAKARRKAR